MPNVMTNEVYNQLRAQINDALKRRDELRNQQLIIDEQVEDTNRVILALERSIRTLRPVIEPMPTQAEVDRVAAEALATEIS